MLARSAWITRWNSNQVPWDPRLCARVPARSSNHARPPWNRLRELHRVPARRGLLLLARSVLITRWNSNQVPSDLSRELHRVPAPMDHSMALQPGPHGSKVVHHACPWIQGCASCWPMNPWLCILPALGSMVVHHAGLWIHGCASSPGPQLQPGPLGSIEGTASSTGPRGSLDGTPTKSPWSPSRELHRVPAPVDHSMESNHVPWDPSKELHRVTARRGLHHAGPVGVDHSMERQPGPLGSMVVHTFTQCLQTSAYVHPRFADVCIRSPHVCRRLHTSGLWIQGCASCWPWDP